jgi:hypothetical protein
MEERAIFWRTLVVAQQIQRKKKALPHTLSIRNGI